MTQQLQTETDCALVSRLGKKRAFWIAFTIGFAVCGSASAQTVGRTTSVKPGVFRNTAPTTVGAPVAQNDLMNTDEQGRTNLQFVDRSTLDIGPARTLESTALSIIPTGRQPGPRSRS